MDHGGHRGKLYDIRRGIQPDVLVGEVSVLTRDRDLSFESIGRIAMMRIAMAGIICLGLVHHALGQAALPTRTLQALKEGTVFIRAGGDNTGSGFVVEVDDDTVYCITNAHVVGRKGEDVRVVLDSGTERARVFQAKVAAFDEDVDLAVLTFTADNPPTPLRFSRDYDVPETTPVFVLGFPFGQLLSANKTPEVTVSRASIAAQRRDADGIIEHLQLDGELNPGNSGGPIVDSDGKVVGVAVAKLNQTNISFGISVQSVQLLLAGRIRGLRFTPASGDQANAIVSVEVRVLDPLERIRTIWLLTAPADAQKDADSGTAGDYKALSRAKIHRLDFENGVATGQIRVPRDEAERPQLFQVRYSAKGSGIAYTQPGELPLGDALNARPSNRGKSDKRIARRHASESPEPTEAFGEPEGPLAQEMRIALPAEAEQAEVAGAGQYWVLKLRNTPALVVVDLFTGEIAKYIPLPSPAFTFGAGGNRAVVHLRDDNILQAYDLTTFERVKSKPNPFGRGISHILMGDGRGGRAIVRHNAGGSQPGRFQAGLLDTERLVELEPQLANQSDRDKQPGIRFRNMSPKMPIELRANHDLTMVTEWVTQLSPSGVGLLTWRDGDFEYRQQHDSRGYLAIGDDNRIYTGSGAILDDRLNVFGEIEHQALIPGIGGQFYLGRGNGGALTAYQSGSLNPISQIGDFPDWSKDRARGDYRVELQFDQRIVFAPKHGRIAFIAQDDKTVVVRNFDLQAALDQSGVDYLVVMSRPEGVARVGKLWEYQVDAISRACGIEYSLELAPEGMEIGKDGLIRWTPPASAPIEPVAVILLIKDKSGEQTFHQFNVEVAGS